MSIGISLDALGAVKQPIRKIIYCYLSERIERHANSYQFNCEPPRFFSVENGKILKLKVKNNLAKDTL